MALNLKDITLLEKLGDSDWAFRELREKLVKKKDVNTESKSENPTNLATNSTNVLVEVLQEDIDYCLSKRVLSYNPCPITRRLKIMFPTAYVFVNYGMIMADKKYVTPIEARQFVLDWDRMEKPVKPIKFILSN